MDCKMFVAYNQNIFLHFLQRGCVRLWPRTGRHYVGLCVLWLCVCSSMLVAAIKGLHISSFPQAFTHLLTRFTAVKGVPLHVYSWLLHLHGHAL